ncbi:hypothetical protein DFH07DRAFT_976869 [Mycena maculata]|uniref:Uncharacterized protein n=1 Tax=Mycena maculata TaxID=230809 RepID=A0AAD7K3K5_9AGAR|nr:hypothetical protein DFH07DRAFT_976869 [Mycena maculata]
MTRHHEHLILLNDMPDVFVQAQTTRFGLTRQTLGAESSVLVTLLENTPSDNGPPVIELDEDLGKLQIFFRIMCDDGALSGFLRTSSTGFRLGELAVLLEMSTKYEAKQIRAQTIALLSATFPTTFATFTRQHTYGMRRAQSEYLQDRFETLPSINAFEAFLVLSAAQKANAGALVLSILYRCATSLSPDEITSPAKDPEGHGTVCLSLQDQRICLSGRQRCLDHIVQFMTFCIEGQLEQRPKECWKDECIRQKLREFNRLRTITNPDLLAFQWDARDTWNASPDECYERVMIEWSRARLLFWNRLPQFFGMVPWWVLRDQTFENAHNSASLLPSIQLANIPGEIIAHIFRTHIASHPSAARSMRLISRDINTIATDELYRTVTLRNADNGASPFWNLSAVLSQKQLPIQNLDLLGLTFYGHSSSRFYFNRPDVSAAMWNFLDQETLQNLLISSFLLVSTIHHRPNSNSRPTVSTSLRMVLDCHADRYEPESDAPSYYSPDSVPNWEALDFIARRITHLHIVHGILDDVPFERTFAFTMFPQLTHLACPALDDEAQLGKAGYIFPPRMQMLVILSGCDNIHAVENSADGVRLRRLRAIEDRVYVALSNPTPSEEELAQAWNDDIQSGESVWGQARRDTQAWRAEFG